MVRLGLMTSLLVAEMIPSLAAWACALVFAEAFVECKAQGLSIRCFDDAAWWDIYVGSSFAFPFGFSFALIPQGLGVVTETNTHGRRYSLQVQTRDAHTRMYTARISYRMQPNHSPTFAGFNVAPMVEIQHRRSLKLCPF